MKNISIVFSLFVLINSKTSYSQCYSSGQYLPAAGFLVDKTGISELDSMVESEVTKLESFYKVKIDFFYLLEQYSKNALYDPRCSNYYCNGTIMLGLKLIRDLFKKKDDFKLIKGVLSHEFAHCVQHLMGWKEWYQKRPELHADFMAGYYIGSNYNYSEKELEIFYSEFESMGDYNYFNPEFHGTPEERKCAFLEGCYYAKENDVTVETANAYGIFYVIADNPCGIRKYKAVKKQIEKDIRTNNVGRAKIIALNENKKYKIIAVTNDGEETYYLNHTKIRTYYNGGVYVVKGLPKINFIEMRDLSVNLVYTVKIYRYSWLFDDYYYLFSTSFKPDKDMTTFITLKNNKAYTSLYLPLEAKSKEWKKR